MDNLRPTLDFLTAAITADKQAHPSCVDWRESWQRFLRQHIADANWLKLYEPLWGSMFNTLNRQEEDCVHICGPIDDVSLIIVMIKSIMTLMGPVLEDNPDCFDAEEAWQLFQDQYPSRIKQIDKTLWRVAIRATLRSSNILGNK